MSEVISGVVVMIDGAGLDRVQILLIVGRARRQELAARNQKLIMSACWADCHPAESIDPYQLDLPGGDRPIRPGGEGTPELAGFAVAEFGVELGLSIGITERFIGEAWDVRHRLPGSGAACHHEIEGFHAQLIARETAPSS